MRGLISTTVFIASVGSLVGVFERAFAAIRLTWKFGFDQVESVHLVPQSFWLFTLVFSGLVLGTALLGLRWRARFPGSTYVRWLCYAQTVQVATLALILVMFGGRFFVLS